MVCGGIGRCCGQGGRSEGGSGKMCAVVGVELRMQWPTVNASLHDVVVNPSDAVVSLIGRCCCVIW